MAWSTGGKWVVASLKENNVSQLKPQPNVLGPKPCNCLDTCTQHNSTSLCSCPTSSSAPSTRQWHMALQTHAGATHLTSHHTMPCRVSVHPMPSLVYSYACTSLC